MNLKKSKKCIIIASAFLATSSFAAVISDVINPQKPDLSDYTYSVAEVQDVSKTIAENPLKQKYYDIAYQEFLDYQKDVLDGEKESLSFYAKIKPLTNDYYDNLIIDLKDKKELFCEKNVLPKNCEHVKVEYDKAVSDYDSAKQEIRLSDSRIEENTLREMNRLYKEYQTILEDIRKKEINE